MRGPMNMNMGGPGYPMGGPGNRPMSGPPGPPGPPSQMYGVSSGMGHSMQEKEAEAEKSKQEERPKVVYASAPVITIHKERKKKKKKKTEVGDGVQHDSSASKTDTSASATETGTTVETTTPTVTTPAASSMEVEDDFHVADMELDGPYQQSRREKREKKKKFVRMAAGTVWEDQSLSEWDPDDFRIFCGDLGNEVTDETLARAFSKYPSFTKAKVLRDKRSNKTKGYGFVSFKDPNDYVRAMREMNGKYVGNRPIKLRKSTWKDRNIDVVKRKEKEKKRLGLK